MQALHTPLTLVVVDIIPTGSTSQFPGPPSLILVPANRYRPDDIRVSLDYPNPGLAECFSPTLSFMLTLWWRQSQRLVIRGLDSGICSR